MKKNVLILFFSVISTITFANSIDTLASKKVIFNVDLGLSGAMYQLEYYSHDTVSFNIKTKQYYRDYTVLPSIGISLRFKAVKLKTEYLIPRLVRFNLGYNLGSLVRLQAHKKVYVSLSYAVQNPFYFLIIRTNNIGNTPFPTPLIGLDLTYQYKKFEFYYNLLKYQRFTALDSKEHLHILGVRFNFIKEK
jgi:hypothetical protein